MYGVLRVTSLLLSDFDKISQISQSVSKRSLFFPKKKEIASFAFKRRRSFDSSEHKTTQKKHVFFCYCV